MNAQLLKVLVLSLGLGCLHSAQAQAATLASTTKTAVVSTGVVEKQSPIEKALSQQKRNDNKFSLDNDQLKIMTSIKTAPTQTFLADQHQRFSRLLQSIFQPHSS